MYSEDKVVEALEKKSDKEWAYAITIKTHGLAKSSKPTRKHGETPQ